MRVDSASLNERISVDEEAQVELRMLREITTVYVHRNDSLLAQRFGHRKIIAGIFDALSECIDAKDFDIFPAQYREFLVNDEVLHSLCGDVGRKAQLRILSDMICSLTDAQAKSYYGRMLGLAPGTVVDHIIP